MRAIALKQSCGGEFIVQQTHGIPCRNESRVIATSQGLGWTSLYASSQLEQPNEDYFPAIEDHLIIMHLDGPVGATRLLGKARMRKVLTPGGLTIQPGGVEFGLHLEGPANSLHIYLRRQIVDDIAASLGIDRVSIAPSLGTKDLLLEQLAISVQDALSEKAFGTVYPDYLARSLAVRLLHRHSMSITVPEPSPQGGFSKVQLQRAIDFMEAHLADSPTLSELSSVLGLSPSHFARRFKVATGVPPHQYLIKLRIDRAKRLLRKCDTVIDVALACGFAHQGHLTRVFRRMVGVTPTDYRRSIIM